MNPSPATEITAQIIHTTPKASVPHSTREKRGLTSNAVDSPIIAQPMRITRDG